MKTQSRVRWWRLCGAFVIATLSICGVADAQAVKLDRETPVAIRAWPKLSLPESWVAVDVHVGAHAENRTVRIVVEGADFYASSNIQLEGDVSARLHRRRWNSLPPGEYEVKAILQRLDGEELSAIDTFVVAGERGPR